MDSADRARILKLIGMLGSEFAGEQSNAASMLGVMARNNKMTITELVAWAYKPETSKPPLSSISSIDFGLPRASR